MSPLAVLHVVRGMTNSSGTTHIVKPLAEEQARQGASVSLWACEQRGEPPVLPAPSLVDSRLLATSLPFDHPVLLFLDPFALPAGFPDSPGLNFPVPFLLFSGFLASFFIFHLLNNQSLSERI